MVYGKNPRRGFFRENVFYHPELAFQLRFPARWQTQNLAQAVVGVSREAPAALELTQAPRHVPINHVTSPDELLHRGTLVKRLVS